MTSRVRILNGLARTQAQQGHANAIADGEFHVDLYTLPDSLVKMLWDFTASKTDL
jgi:transcription initiation factor IIF auxiliary subunit